jgi:hypothetical protein
MEILRPATEDEVLECFVRAERDSERYGETVRKLLEILYINWDWWLRLTNGTWRPRAAAANHPADEGDRRIAKAAATNPPLIAVVSPAPTSCCSRGMCA